MHRSTRCQHLQGLAISIQPDNSACAPLSFGGFWTSRTAGAGRTARDSCVPGDRHSEVVIVGQLQRTDARAARLQRAASRDTCRGEHAFLIRNGLPAVQRELPETPLVPAGQVSKLRRRASRSTTRLGPLCSQNGPGCLLSLRRLVVMVETRSSEPEGSSN
jgi:hypothetical protein